MPRLRGLARLLVLGCVLAGGSTGLRGQEPASAAHTWKTYTNVRFQYSICYPADLLVPQGEPENADGQKFLAKDGARLMVFGSNNALEQSLDAFLAQTEVRLGGPSGSVTYKVMKNDRFVVSGRNGSDIFYAKTLSGHDQFKSMELVYDHAEATVYAPLVDRLAGCFVDLAH
jgi:predicted nucleotidyltransferase